MASPKDLFHAQCEESIMPASKIVAFQHRMCYCIKCASVRFYEIAESEQYFCMNYYTLPNVVN